MLIYLPDKKNNKTQNDSKISSRMVMQITKVLKKNTDNDKNYVLRDLFKLNQRRE